MTDSTLPKPAGQAGFSSFDFAALSPRERYKLLIGTVVPRPIALVTTVAGLKIASPRIGEAPVAFECRHHVTLSIGSSRDIILGEVVEAHLRSDIVDPQKLYVDPAALDAIGRMGGHGYASTRDYFDLKTMTVEGWRGQGDEANRREPRPSRR